MKKDIKKEGFYISSPEENVEAIYAEGDFKEYIEEFLGKKDILFITVGLDFLTVGLEVEVLENKCITRVAFEDITFSYSKSGTSLGIPYQVIKILSDYKEI